MSHGARSAGAIGCPKRGASAARTGAAAIATATPIIAAPATTRSRERIACLPSLVDPPAGDGIVVVLPAQPAVGDELRARGLHHAGIVGGAALQQRRAAVPLPGGAKTRERLRQHGLLQRSAGPALAAVGRHLGRPHAALPRAG